MSIVVMIDGRLCTAEEATVSVFDRGFLYGDSVFETVRTYSGKLFALSEHLDRLEKSASKVFIDLPVSQSQLRQEIQSALGAAGNPESYVRVMITRGQGTMGLDPALAEKPLRVIIVDRLTRPPAALYQRGAHVVSFRTSRPSDMTEAEGAKIGNYLVAVLAMRVAREQGAHEALVVDSQGRVVEGASSNVFCVVDGKLQTPPTEAGILAGITRDRVLQGAASLGVPVSLKSPTLSDLKQADEVFVSSSIRELLPVVQVDGDPIGSGVPGPVTHRLHEEFLRSVAEELALR